MIISITVVPEIMKNVQQIRDMFVTFIEDNQIDMSLSLYSVRTSLTVSELKYDRIEVYEVSMLVLADLQKIVNFVTQYHDYLNCWFAFGLLHIGFRIPSGYRNSKVSAFVEAT